MKGLLWLLAVFAAAVALAVVGRTQEGYVLFVYPPYRVELSLVLFAIVLAAGFFAAYLLLRLLVHTLRLPEYVRAYRLRCAAAKRAGCDESAGLAYMEGRYARAENRLKRPLPPAMARPRSAARGALRASVACAGTARCLARARSPPPKRFKPRGW